MTNKALGRSLKRFFYLMVVVLGVVSALYATGPTMTTITDVVYRANGLPARGTIVVTWPAFNTADGKPVAAGVLSIEIGAEGTVNFALVPNEGGDPGGTFYKAVFKLADGTTYTEYWVVPVSSPTTIAAIRASVVPRQVGAQFVNRQYVDTAMAATNQQVVHKAGSEDINGVKSFAASPEVPAPANGVAAVNKDYVTGAISAISDGFVDKGGDTMTGPLTLLGDPVAPGHATNRQYVDLQVADIGAGLTLKLGRLNDTPINLASVKYANQFVPGGDVSAQVNAACADLAGSPGTVTMPSAMEATGLRSSLPDSCRVFDDRRTMGPNEFGTESPALMKGLVYRFRWTAPNSDVANGSASTSQTFQGMQLFIDSSKGGINNGTLGATTKSNYRGAGFTISASTPGQHTALEGKCIKFSAGDCFGVAGFAESWGGSRNGFGDEASTPVTSRLIQGNSMFTGTVGSKNANTIVFSTTTNHQTVGAGTRWLRNLSNDICTSTDGSSPCNGTTASFAPGSATVTASPGTPWAALANPSERCFSQTINGYEYTIPVSSVGGGGSTLTLAFVASAFVSTTPANYKIHYCSETSEVVAVDKTGTTPAFATQLSLVDASRFTAGNLTDLPISHLWGGTGVKIVVTPTVPTSVPVTGIGLSNNGASLASLTIPNAIVVGGNFRRGIEFNGHTVAQQYGIEWGTGPAPGVLFPVFDNADTATIVHTLINRRAATGGDTRLSYLNTTDQWAIGSNSSYLYHFKTTAPNMGIGTVGLAGTALHIVPAGTDNGVTITGNATGHLLNAQVGSVTRFLVNSTQALFSNGLDVKGYADNQTTQKWQITGSNGKANFNGGVCLDSAQSICATSGAGAPSGACVTGSTYKRSDGGSASTLYVCEGAAWVAVGGSSSGAWNSIGNPSGAQALSMEANTSTWTWNAATGAATDLVRLTDSASNTGTGHLMTVETAASSNAKPFQVKARGTTSLEINEFGVISSLGAVTTGSGLAIQVGGTLQLKGRDDWSAPVTVSGSDFSGSSATASNATLRGGDATSSSGSTTGGTLLLRSGGTTSASGSPGNLQVAQTYVKDTSVTSGYLQCFKAAAAMTVGDCGNSAINAVGVAISASNTNPVVAQFQGVATLQFDATASPSAGWFACTSASAGGKVIVQAGACAAGRLVGIVAQNGTSITSGKVFLQSR